MDDGGKLPLMAQTPPDEEISDALRVAKEPVRYDTGPQPGEPVLSSYDPTIKERIYQTVAGTETRPSPERAGFARGVSQMAEFAPFLGNVMAGQEAYRRGDTKGMLMAAVPLPGAAKEGAAVRAAENLIAPKTPKPIQGMNADDVLEALRVARKVIPKNDPKLMWHGSASGELVGGKTGLHLGTYEAAKQALEARVGVPAEGEWAGLREWGKTPLAGRERLLELDPRGYLRTGYNVEAPTENYLPVKSILYANKEQMPFDVRPSILPYRITGKMVNLPYLPYEDFAANARMQGLLTRGNARRGIYYKNIAEDPGSISAVVPSEKHVEPIDLKRLLETGKFSTGGTASGTMNDDVESALRIANSRLGRADGGEIPTPPRRPDDLEHYAVMADAQKKFPFINKYDPHIKVEPREGNGMYSEFYNAEETGDPNNPSDTRPAEFPLGSSGVRVYRPEEFTPADYAAEYLHGDPVANKTREELISRLTPEQLDFIKGQKDYQDSIGLGLSEERALNNVVDAMMRGYTMQDEPSHQWPKESLAELDFTPEELELLNSLQDYVEAPAQAAPSPEAAPAEETPERKLGGKINTIVDADPYFRLSNLKKGGSIDRALRLSRDHMAYGGLPDSYMDDDRYKTFQQMGGTKTDPRSEAIGRFLPRMTYHESRDRPLAGAKTSSAAGLAQFTRPTWRKITEGEPEVAGKSREELYAMRRDPSEEGQRFHMRMAEKLANQNADMLEKAGLPVTPQNLYAAHFGGPHGVRAAAAPVGTPLSRIFSRGEIRANPFLRGQTAEGFRKFAQNAISETPRGLPTDLEFQRSQSPTNRYEGLQTAMAGAQPQTPPTPPTPPTQMAYAQPQQRGFSPDLMTPHPVPQPTRMAHLPDMQVGGQRMMAADRGSMEGTGPKMFADRGPGVQDRGPMVGGSGPGVPETQTAMAQPMPQQEPQIEQATYQPEPERPNQDMLEGIEQPFVGWPDFASLFADGGVVGDALRLATGGRTPAWTRAAGKAKSGGLNAKGRASYNRANPGKPGLKPPAPHPKTERDANRRKSFCARMKGMRRENTSAETARDPDSRINKSLRAWNCADGGQVWDKPRPKHLGEPEPLSAKQKKSAKAAAKAAGRPYPNFVDNVRVAQKKK